MGRFKDGPGGSIEFRSAWKTQAATNNISTLTNPIDYEDAETQTITMETQDTQTLPVQQQDPIAKEATDLNDEILDFLEIAGNRMIVELNKNRASCAFEGSNCHTTNARQLMMNFEFRRRWQQ